MSEKELKYKLVPVDAIPEMISNQRRSRYYNILQEFAALNIPFAHFDLECKRGTTNGQFEAFGSCLNYQAKKRGLNIKVMRRAGNIYLANLDLAPKFKCSSEPLVAETASSGTRISSSDPRLSTDVEELELSVRTYNCLKNAGLRKVGDIVRLTQPYLSNILGRKCVRDLGEYLAVIGLEVGMVIETDQKEIA